MTGADLALPHSGATATSRSDLALTKVQVQP